LDWGFLPPSIVGVAGFFTSLLNSTYGGMGRERNLVIDNRITDFQPTTHIKGTVNRQGIRKMTPGEWARLQGFPDSYLIPVADASAYKQFGNSVAVPAIEATANEILKLISVLHK
jgi:DNA (cytosine-5)-methyltransferase 1